MVPMCRWLRRNLSTISSIGVVFTVHTFMHLEPAPLPIPVLLLLCLEEVLGNFPHVVPFPYMERGEMRGRHCELSVDK